MIPVILSGGSGTRLWPVSRKTHPKQFWPLLSDDSMLQDTCNRVRNYPGTQPPVIVCNEDHRFFVAHQMQESDFPDSAIILEPVGRNTAPAVAVAAFHALQQADAGEDPVMLILPADHVIRQTDTFHEALQKAEILAGSGHLVTFGIVPTAAETGYGYIQSGDPLKALPEASRVSRFVEKPDQETALQYVESGDYFWNSGMFMFTASTYLEALQEFAPEMLAAAKKSWEQAEADNDFIRLQKQAFAECPSDSIDYAVMEHTGNGVVIPLNAGWSDVGSWSALWEIGNKDPQGNVKIGDVLAQDTNNSYLRSDGRLLATVGLDDIMVIDTHDVVLIAHKSQVQKVRDLVSQLNDEQREEINIHSIVHRPWGCYQGIDRGERYQVKRISVAPGATLSLQMHHHRAEHWIVVRGTARVTRGDETFILSENESAYIRIGELHRLENPGKIPLEIIEVQSGSYLGEDDIERLEDVYGR
jgi:mannose-1-phosphate guanylyltransferase/mannose-6-phosphate isomerase